MPTISAYIHTELRCYDTWTSQGKVTLPGSFTFQFPASLQHELEMIHKWHTEGRYAKVQVESNENLEKGKKIRKEGRRVQSWPETFSKPKGREKNVFLEIRIPSRAMQMLFMSCGLVCVWEIVIYTTLYTVFFSRNTVSGKYGIPQKTA